MASLPGRKRRHGIVIGNDDDSDDDLPLSSPVSTPNRVASVVARPIPGNQGQRASPARRSPARKDSPPSRDDSDLDLPFAVSRKKARVSSPAPSTRRQVKPKAKTPASPGNSSPVRAARRTKSEATTKTTTKKKRHVFTEAHFEPINCWWDKPPKSVEDAQWTYLEHHGIMFTPPYVAHGVPIVYQNREVQIPPAAEEVINYWCSAHDSAYAEKEKFRDNFWAAFLSKFPDDHPLIQGFYDDPATNPQAQIPADIKTGRTKKPIFEPRCEFLDIKNVKAHLDRVKDNEKNRRKGLSKEEREAEKLKKLAEEGPHLYCMHDWIREKVGVYKAEVPGLFRGRGEHPKMGLLKKRLFPDDVTFNCSEDAPVPRLPDWLSGHSWCDIYHDPHVTWLSFYKDSVNQQFKYVFLGAGSAVKGAKDHSKYELARKLKLQIKDIRADYESKMRSKDVQEQQMGTAAYVIDYLALRAGNEKDREEEADTVGCCSLRKEHIQFEDEPNTITLDFLGKDSIRYRNTVKISPLAYKNIKSFCSSKKKPTEDVFDSISPSLLNRYFSSMMPGLSAKVFRTYNASITLQQELSKIHEEEHAVVLGNVEDIKRFYDYANRQVAILCNHQRSVPRAHEVSMGKLQKQLEYLIEDIMEVTTYINHVKSGTSRPFSFTAAPREEGEPVRVAICKEGYKEEQAMKKLNSLESRKATLELRMRVKDENKTVSNTTSKQHYMDPRITVTFCKKYEVPIEKIFSSTLLKKFPWAMFAKREFVW